MESFSLLRFWRGGCSTSTLGPSSATATATPSPSVLFPSAAETDTDGDDGDDEGSFFDLNFTIFPSRPNKPDEDDHPSADEETELKGEQDPATSSLPADAPDSRTPQFFLVSLMKKKSAAITKLRLLLMPRSPPKQPSKKISVKIRVDDQDDAAALMVQRYYLSKIKPLYVRIISKRYGEKLRVSDDDEMRDGEETVVRKRYLGKSKSAPLRAMAATSTLGDDSRLEQEDGIRRAIAHCKSSFSAAQGVVGDRVQFAASGSRLVRSMSDPGEGRLEGKDKGS